MSGRFGVRSQMRKRVRGGTGLRVKVVVSVDEETPCKRKIFLKIFTVQMSR